MEIYNEQMERIENPDLNLGWLEDTFRTVHHEAIEAVEEIWHYEVIAEYEGGGKDVVRVIDMPGVEGRDAWDEEIPIQIYHPYTEEELRDMQEAAARPTIEERMGRIETALELLRGSIETAMSQWTDMLAAKEGE